MRLEVRRDGGAQAGEGKYAGQELRGVALALRRIRAQEAGRVTGGTRSGGGERFLRTGGRRPGQDGLPDHRGRALKRVVGLPQLIFFKRLGLA